VATHSFPQTHVDPSYASVHLAEAGSVFLAAAAYSAASPSGEQAYDRPVPKDALNCAKGTVAALGLEIGAAIFLYGIWLTWHLIR
jgi:hypothetical protein